MISRVLGHPRKSLLLIIQMAAAVLLGSAAGNGQTAPAPLRYEVASIKRADPDARPAFDFSPSGDVTATITTKFLVQFAFGLPDYRVLGGGRWFEYENYRIVAKPPEGPLPDKQRMQVEAAERIRSLLAERFHLEAHRETRELPVYSLVVAKDGPKLREVPRDPNFKLRLGKGRIVAHGAKIDLLATLLANHLNRSVLNNTGLDNYYDITLEYAIDETLPDAGPSIFTALQEQLGLRLEARKGPVEVLIIDTVARPSEN